MKNPQDTLREWRSVKPKSLPLAALKEDPALQPRDATLLKYLDKPRQEQLSVEHVGRFRGILLASAEQNLDPILVTDTGQGLYVVDGHHRLKAYKLASRSTIPARVLKTDMRIACLVSKLVNLKGVKLPLHRDQAQEALWQYLAGAVERGPTGLPKGDSTRSLNALFGISHTTVAVMAKKLREVNLSDWGSAALDPGTGWPRYKYVRGNSHKQPLGELTHDQIRQRKAEKAAAAISKVLESHGPEAFSMGVSLLLRESSDPERAEAQKALKDLTTLLNDIEDPFGDF